MREPDYEAKRDLDAERPDECCASARRRALDDAAAALREVGYGYSAGVIERMKVRDEFAPEMAVAEPEEDGCTAKGARIGRAVEALIVLAMLAALAAWMLA